MAIPDYVLPIVDASRDKEVAESAWTVPDMDPAHTNGFRNFAPTWLSVANDDDVAVILVSVKGVRPCSQNEVHDDEKEIQPGGGAELGPFDRHHYSDVDGYVHFTVTNVSGTADPAKIGVVAVRRI